MRFIIMHRIIDKNPPTKHMVKTDLVTVWITISAISKGQK